MESWKSYRSKPCRLKKINFFVIFWLVFLLSPVGSSALNRRSSESSVSSSDSVTPQSQKSHNVSTACSSGINSNGHTHTECNNIDAIVNGYRGISDSCRGQKTGSSSNIADSSSNIHVYKEEGKLEEAKTTSCSSKAVSEKGCSRFDSKPQSSVSVTQGVQVHTLLTYVEMCELLKRCEKPMMTLGNIGAQEFDILVTDIVDSCHFWANIDDEVSPPVGSRFRYITHLDLRRELSTLWHQCAPYKGEGLLEPLVFFCSKLYWNIMVY